MGIEGDREREKDGKREKDGWRETEKGRSRLREERNKDRNIT